MSFGMRNIYNAVRDIRIAGHQHDDIEAFIINTEDLHELFQSAMFPNENGMGFESEGGLKIMGIQIIDSHHVPKGTIFKTLKNNNKQYPPGWGYDEYGNNYAPNPPPTVPCSGFIFPSFEAPIGAVQEMKKFGESAKAVGGFNKATENLPVIKEEKPRHSTTRKVQLD